MPMLERTLAGTLTRSEAMAEATNRRGRPVRMLLEYLLLRDDEGAHRGVIIVMNEALEQR